jgi:hypothetical protein
MCQGGSTLIHKRRAVISDIITDGLDLAKTHSKYVEVKAQAKRLYA